MAPTRKNTATTNKSQGRSRGPERIGDVLAGLMARRGYARLDTASAFAESWEEAAGAKLAGKSRPGNVRRGVLEVMVENSAVMQELTFQKMQVLGALGRLLPDQKIRDLRFRVGQID